MKANQKIKSLSSDNSGDTKVIGGLVALLLTIIVCVMVYFEVTTSIDQLDATTTETFSGYTLSTSNESAITLELDNSPVNSANTNVTCYNSTGHTESYPTFSLNMEVVSFAAESSSEFSQINVTYTTHTSAIASDDITPMATTVFSLLPIIALVVVAAVILGVILGFGGGSKQL
jgi:hypothetical protein